MTSTNLDKKENICEEKEPSIPYGIYAAIVFFIILLGILIRFRENIVHKFLPTLVIFIYANLASLFVCFLGGGIGKKIFKKNQKAGFGFGFFLGPVGYIFLAIIIYFFDKKEK